MTAKIVKSSPFKTDMTPSEGNNFKKSSRKSVPLSYDDYDSSDDVTDITYSSSDTDTDDEEEASITSQIQIPNIISKELVESDRSCSTISRDSKKVKFSTVTVREYPRIVGEHIPTRGPPLSIDWDYSKEQIHHVDDYEESVLVCGTTRRFPSKLKKLPVQQRIELLRLESGCTMKQILEATKHSNIIRNQRKRTREVMHLQPVHELCEKIIRRITKN